MFFWNYIFLFFWNFRHRLVRLYWYLLIIFFVLLIFIILDHINTSSPNSAASHLSHCFRYICAVLLDIWIGLHVLPAFFLQVNIFQRKIIFQQSLGDWWGVIPSRVLESHAEFLLPLDWFLVLSMFLLQLVCIDQIPSSQKITCNWILVSGNMPVATKHLFKKGFPIQMDKGLKQKEWSQTCARLPDQRKMRD